MINPIKPLNDYFSDESKWCKHALGYNQDQIAVHPLNGDAIRCCLIGGMMLTMEHKLLFLEQTFPDLTKTLLACVPKIYQENFLKPREVLVYFNNAPETSFSIFKEFLNRAEALWDEEHPKEQIVVERELEFA